MSTTTPYRTPDLELLRRMLGTLHQTPEQAWSVAALAREGGMSRSTFAARFRSLVKSTPLAYLGDQPSRA
jgi:transcriptional regulator GlxA family with amidase domain